ncbi:MAG: hypothetical protein HZC36_06250 [Armatimonadetes bacterium]|nr:hypothetical protein [Armatimonadota bacterium]
MEAPPVIAPPGPAARRKRRRRLLFWILGCTLGAIVFAILVLYFTVKGALDRGIDLAAGDAARSLPAERAAAKAEGLPLTPAELFADREKVRDEDNAAPIYLKAIAEMKAVRTKNRSAVYDKMTAARALLKGDQTGIAPAKDLLSGYAEPLTLAEGAVLKPRCDFHRNWNDGLVMLLPELADLKTMSRLFALRAILRAQAKDFSGAEDDLRTALKVAAHTADEPGLIQMLVGMACATDAHAAIRQIAVLCRKTPQELAQLALVEGLTPPLDPVSAIKADCVADVTSIRDIPKIVNDPIMEVSPMEKAFATNPKLIQAGEARTIRYWREVLRVVRSGKSGPEILKGLDKLDEQEISPDLVLSALGALDSAAPASARSGQESILRYRTMRAQTRAFLAVLAYHAEHHRWPKALSEIALVGDDEIAAKPLQYKALRNGFKIWGVGKNRKDDRGVFGKTQDEGDQLIWYEEGKGLIQPLKKK